MPAPPPTPFAHSRPMGAVNVIDRFAAWERACHDFHPERARAALAELVGLRG